MKPHLTAITRKSVPVPVDWLIRQNLIQGDVLDFGCGKCANINNQIFGKLEGVTSISNFDPFFENNPDVLNRQYDIILCTYVLCILPESEEVNLLKQIQTCLKPGGTAYITVRKDIPKQGHGISKRNTFQRDVNLNLNIVKKRNRFAIYQLTKTENITK